MSWKYAHTDCNIKVKWNQDILVVFDNLKNYDSHLTMQVLVKFDFKISIIPNGMHKYITINSNNKLAFTDSLQFFNFSSDKLTKTLGKDNFNYLSQEVDSDVLRTLSLWVYK